MNVILFALVVTGFIVLIYILFERSDKEINSEQMRQEVSKHSEDENHRFMDEFPRLSSDQDLWSTQQPETDRKPNENVTLSLTSVADQSRCPACGTIITAHDERCPSCEIAFVTDGIAFVTDGSRNWTPKSVGPADGIYLPPTEFRK